MAWSPRTRQVVGAVFWPTGPDKNLIYSTLACTLRYQQFEFIILPTTWSHWRYHSRYGLCKSYWFWRYKNHFSRSEEPPSVTFARSCNMKNGSNHRVLERNKTMTIDTIDRKKYTTYPDKYYSLKVESIRHTITEQHFLEIPVYIKLYEKIFTKMEPCSP